jgi:hypothetical protein
VTFGGSVRFLIVWFSWDAVMVSIAVLNEGNSDIRSWLSATGA